MADDVTPVPAKSFVKDSDLIILTTVGAAALLVWVLFGVALFRSGLVDFPDMTNPDGRDYFADTLAYRERRVALALVLRTFITGFSFVVGLAICTMGGLFILRQVTSLTTITGGIGPDAIDRLGVTPEEQGKRLKETQFAFSAYSPGVLFLVGGVFIMAVTQYLAISVSTIEVVPSSMATSFCQEPGTARWVQCSSSDPGRDGALQSGVLGVGVQTGTAAQEPQRGGLSDD